MAREAALLFTDIVDSTSTTQRLGNDRAAHFGPSTAGALELGQSLIDEALPMLRIAADLSRAIGNRRVYGQVLRGLGAALLAHGNVDEARSAFEQALAIARSTTNRRIEATCLSAGRWNACELRFSVGRPARLDAQRWSGLDRTTACRHRCIRRRKGRRSP